MVRTATHKLIYRRHGVSELYDLEADAREVRNIYGTAAIGPVQHALERRLLDWYLCTSDVTPWGENPRGMPVAAG